MHNGKNEIRSHFDDIILFYIDTGENAAHQLLLYYTVLSPFGLSQAFGPFGRLKHFFFICPLNVQQTQ